ncbi:hypothetical protein GCM10007973_12610 [Polymorphobacter multimanifer]|nr:hypothetical protein GCM10007973_12610 [Polymorphobacter multimanifer]
MSTQPLLLGQTRRVHNDQRHIGKRVRQQQKAVTDGIGHGPKRQLYKGVDGQFAAQHRQQPCHPACVGERVRQRFPNGRNRFRTFRQRSAQRQHRGARFPRLRQLHGTPTGHFLGAAAVQPLPKFRTGDHCTLPWGQTPSFRRRTGNATPPPVGGRLAPGRRSGDLLLLLVSVDVARFRRRENYLSWKR